MVWNVFFVFVFSIWGVNSMDGYYQPPRTSAVWGYFTPPVLQRVPPEKTAMEAMVELTNDLGIALLQDHSFSRGNFAFSPYGVASVLVVLYEGARGESAQQIHRAVKFPLDKDMIRVGFRDIHRHLSSYFSHEGYLSGISLNKQASSLKPEYKKILKFYGYDIDLNLPFDDEEDSMLGNNVPETTKTTVPPSILTEAPAVSPTDKTVTNTLNSASASPSSVNLTTQQSLETTTSIMTNPETTIKEEPVQNLTEPPEAEKTDQVDISKTTITLPMIEPKDETTTVLSVTESRDTTTAIEPQKETTGFPVTEPKDEATVLPVTEFTDRTTTILVTELQSGTTITKPVVENTTPSVNELKDETTATPMAGATTVPVTEIKEEITAAPTADLLGETTAHPVNGQNVTTAMPVTQSESETTVFTSEDGDEFQLNITIGRNIQCKDGSDCNNTKDTETTPLSPEAETKTTQSQVEEVTNVSIDNGMLIPQSNDTTASQLQREENVNATESVSGRRETKDIKDFEIDNDDDSEINKIVNMLNAHASLWLDEKTKPRKARTIADYLKSPHNPDLSLQLQNGMYGTQVSRDADSYKKLPRLMFLLDGAVDTPVPMMIHTSVFYYAYIPRLHSKALEFPLDDSRYKLLILLPVERRGLRQLIYDLSDCPLSYVLESVRPARVKAIVPTFMVEGFVILTSSLQKLGIWDVFDPRKANLSGMSTDPELFVRNVEQSVTVVIRNYVEILDIQTRTMAARHMEHEFKATHPFLYFVLDSATNVALMAGQILDPLNSRIY